MPWPTPQDYNEAIQNPGLAFSDRELASGHPELTPLGLPRPITGNFASVYHMHTAGCQWAVRCFWREYADMSDRYAAISAHLRRARLPYTVGFEFQPRGMLIRSTWYPLLKMEWVDGELLDDYVERNLRNRSALSELASRWADMIQTLEGAGIAHGDLQHGNVIVVNGDLKLVDYDCMYVPALAGRVSHELGHQNYQHPRRTAADFGPSTDRFSAWLIYVSLLALSRDPDLWNQLAAGDECLLLRSADLIAPDVSSGLRTLLGHRDARVRTVATQLATFLQAGPAAVLPLEAAFEIKRSTVVAAASAGALPAGSRRRSLVAQPGSSLAVDAVSMQATALPSWLEGYVDITASGYDFGPPGAAVQALLALGCLLILLCTAAVVLFPAVLPLEAGVWLGATALSLGTIVAGFYRQSPVRSLRRLGRRQRAQIRALRSLDKACGRERRRREKLLRLLDATRERAAVLEQELWLQEDAERTIAQGIRDHAVRECDDRLGTLDADETAALEATLRARQEAHLRAFLRDRSLAKAPFTSLSWPSRARLWATGVRTAADLSAARMRANQWLGEAALLELAAWRVDAERAGRRSAPSVLTPDARSSVSAPFARVRAEVQAKRASVIEDCERLVAVIERRYARRRQAVAAKQCEGEDSLRRELEEVDARLAAAEARQGQEARRLAAIREDLERYDRITLLRYSVHVLASWWR